MKSSKKIIAVVAALIIVISALAVTVSAASLKAPANVSAASASYNSITVKWSAVSGAKTYTVQFSTDKKNWKTATSTLTAAKYTHSSLATGTTYYYRVMAVAGKTKSAYSATVSAKPVPATPKISSVK